MAVLPRDARPAEPRGCPPGPATHCALARRRAHPSRRRRGLGLDRRGRTATIRDAGSGDPAVPRIARGAGRRELAATARPSRSGRPDRCRPARARRERRRTASAPRSLPARASGPGRRVAGPRAAADPARPSRHTAYGAAADRPTHRAPRRSGGRRDGSARSAATCRASRRRAEPTRHADHCAARSARRDPQPRAVRPRGERRHRPRRPPPRRSRTSPRLDHRDPPAHPACPAALRTPTRSTFLNRPAPSAAQHRARVEGRERTRRPTRRAPPPSLGPPGPVPHRPADGQNRRDTRRTAARNTRCRVRAQVT